MDGLQVSQPVSPLIPKSGNIFVDKAIDGNKTNGENQTIAVNKTISDIKTNDENKTIAVNKSIADNKTNAGNKTIAESKTIAVNKSIADNKTMVEFKPIPREKLPDDLEENKNFVEVIVGEVYSPYKFFVQLKAKSMDLAIMMDAME